MTPAMAEGVQLDDAAPSCCASTSSRRARSPIQHYVRQERRTFGANGGVTSNFPRGRPHGWRPTPPEGSMRPPAGRCGHSR
jgi:hypothetical protein